MWGFPFGDASGANFDRLAFRTRCAQNFMRILRLRMMVATPRKKCCQMAAVGDWRRWSERCLKCRQLVTNFSHPFRRLHNQLVGLKNYRELTYGAETAIVNSDLESAWT